MNHDIKNFTGSSVLTVLAIQSDLAVKYGGFVELVQASGGLRFQHTMTPEQVIELAEVLVAAAAVARAFVESAKEAA